MLLPQRARRRRALLDFGFTAEAGLDDGGLWPTSYAVTEVTDAVADRIAALVAKAVA